MSYARYSGLSSPGASGGTGTVTSVGLSDGSTTPIYNISGSPVTTAGTLAFTFKTQTANIVLAGPSSGGAAQPTFRALVAADIPALSSLYANITLSNLSTTDVNSDLLPHLSSPSNLYSGVNLGSATLPWGGNSYISDLNTFELDFYDGQGNGNFGQYEASIIGNGLLTGGGNADLYLVSGSFTTTGNNVGLAFVTPQNDGSAANPSQSLRFETGTTTGAGSNSGGMSFTTGVASGTRGKLKFVDGSEGTAGNVWTSTDTGGTGHWASLPSGLTVGAIDGKSAVANGLQIVSNVLYAQSADATHPGMVNNTTQTLSGDKTLTGNTLIANNAGSKATIGGASSTAVHQLNGGMNVTTRTVTGDLTIDDTTTDYIIFCNFSAPQSLTLPSPTNGRLLHIKDISGTANTNTITMVRHASEKIEGLAASKVLQTNWGGWTFTSDGTDWFML